MKPLFFVNGSSWLAQIRWTLLALLISFSPLPAWATTVTPPDFEQLVNESDYIVRAVVKNITTERRGEGSRAPIFSRIELDVSEVISGNPPQPLILEMLGGKIGDEEMRIEGAPRFVVGEESILFIQGNGRNIHPLFAMMHGRYHVRKDRSTGREFMCRDNEVPLETPSEVSLPMTTGPSAEMQRRLKSPSRALSPDQLREHIRKARSPTYRRPAPVH